MTGYTPDRVSPSGQLEPPAPNDFPHAGCQISRLKPPEVPMLPFVMLPRPLQESNVIGKGGTAGFLGAAYDPYYFYQDPNKEIKLDDLTLRKEVSKERLERRATLLKTGRERRCRRWKRPSRSTRWIRYYQKAFDLVSSGRARNAFDLTQEPDKVRDRYGRHTFGQGLLLARRLIEAGTRFVQMNWPAVANGDPDGGRLGHPRRQLRPAEEPALPEARQRPLRAARGHGPARPAEGHAGGRHRRIWPLAAPGREHLRQQQRARRPRSLALLLHRADRRRRHHAAARSTASPTPPAPRPPRIRCIPCNSWRRSITRWASTRTPSSTTTSTSRASWWTRNRRTGDRLVWMRKMEPTLVAPIAPPKPANHLLTSEEFLEWLQPGVRADLIGGEIFMQSPVNLRHARLINFVERLLGAYIEREI